MANSSSFAATNTFQNIQSAHLKIDADSANFEVLKEAKKTLKSRVLKVVFIKIDNANIAHDYISERCVPIYVEIGAGEEIRTLDPNLGKVVLYP